MINVEDARKLILDNTFRLGNEKVDILECLNRVVGEEIYSDINIPPFDNSAMDGFAILSSDLDYVSERNTIALDIVETIPAGYKSNTEVKAGMAVKIMTGAPVPKGADAVVPIELVRQEGTKVFISQKLKKWSNIRFKGEDVKEGSLVIPEGKVIGPSEVGMLAALNISKVNVVKSPSMSILSTGDELVELGERLLPGKIRDINSYSLYAQALKYSCKPINLGIARDVEQSIRGKLEIGKNSDILIITGGVSVGDFDYVKDVLLSMGMEKKFWKVAMKPGKPVLFGIMGKTLVFGLPGNPVSVMVTFEQFVLPAIFKLQCKNLRPWKEVWAVMEEDIEKKPGFTNFIRGKFNVYNGNVYAKPIGSQSSGAFSTLMHSDCLIVIPEEVSRVRSGEKAIIQIKDGGNDL